MKRLKQSLQRFWLRFHFAWRRPLGLAASRIDLETLRQQRVYQHATQCLEAVLPQYVPAGLDPVKTLLAAQPSTHLPPNLVDAAALFVQILDHVACHRLSPETLGPVVTIDEIGDYRRKVKHYLKNLAAGQTWPVPFFYLAASEVLRKLPEWQPMALAEHSVPDSCPSARQLDDWLRAQQPASVV